MRSEWETYKLSNLCHIGSSKRIFQHEYVNNGIPFLRSKEVIDKALGSFEPKDLLFISNEKFNEIKSKYNIPKAGELLLSSVGNRSGIPYVIKEADGDFYFKDGNLTWFRNFKSLDCNFLLYWINSSVGQNTLNGIMIGSAQKALTISGLQNLTLTIPPLPTQKKIAHILSTLDDKIELNRKMNQTLEEMAQALFKSWFVDFDPVHAKAGCSSDEELEAAAKELGISKEVLELLPSEFEESELGMIPKGWVIAKIEEILKRYKAPKRYKKDAVESHGKTIVLEQGADIILGYHNHNGEFEATISEPMFIFGDHTCVMKLSTKPFSISENVIPLSGCIRNGYWTYYAVHGQQTFQEYRRHWSELIVKDIVLADEAICDFFAQQVQSLILKIEQNISENNELIMTRDTLLPKLLSGELDVLGVQL